MKPGELSVQINGLAHDHLIIDQPVLSDSLTFGCSAMNENNQQHHIEQESGRLNQEEKLMNRVEEQLTALSTIAILRRHPMYDCLVLVKRYRACLNGYTLEFPTSERADSQNQSPSSKNSHCSRTKLVSICLDGDDPIYQCQEKNCKNNNLSAQDGDLVYVPMNGLIDRLDGYGRRGISVDGRVYAFAMGLKTAERILRTDSMKEVQETPPV